MILATLADSFGGFAWAGAGLAQAPARPPMITACGNSVVIADGVGQAQLMMVNLMLFRAHVWGAEMPEGLGDD